MIRGRKLRAPTTDRELLVDPPFPDLPNLLTANLEHRRSWNYDVGGMSLNHLAETARAELLHDARQMPRRGEEHLPAAASPPVSPCSSPLLISGHQPELFHPGVWSKNFLLDRLAKAVGGTAVNLVIDGDTLKSPTLRVPTGTIDAPRIEAVPFDLPGDEIPYEERTILDRATFDSFGRRTCELLRPFIANPLLETFWPTVVEESHRVRTIGEAFARARHRLEAAWGVTTLEYPQSRLCDGDGFRRFVCHLLAELPRFRAAHNSALLDYRRAEHLRSANHPVPELAADDDWLEAPLWIWSAANPRRRRVFVRRTAEGLELTDRAELRFQLPRGSGHVADAAEALGDLARQGYRLRSRALLTTMYARLVLGDLFLHGIGGGKYDELTDEMIRRFFGFEPPGFAVATATRRLPIARSQPAADEVERLEHRLWELSHQPERFLSIDIAAADASTIAAEMREALAEKRRWTAVEQTRENARERCRAIRRANEHLRRGVGDERTKTMENLIAARRRREAETLLGSREYSSFFFPEKDLRDFFDCFPARGR